MYNHNKQIRSNANYTGLFVIYLVSVMVAITVIIPNEEVWYYGVLKATIWPFYVIAKVG